MNYEHVCRVAEGPLERNAILKEMGETGYRLVSAFGNPGGVGMTFYFLFFTKELDA